MRRFINLDTLEWQRSVDLAVADTQAIRSKYKGTFKLELFFVRNNAAVLLPAGTTLTLGIKPAGKFDGDYLASSTDWTIPTNVANPYVVSVMLEGDDIAAGLSDNSDADDDKPFMEAGIEVEWVEGGDGDIYKSATQKLLILNSIIRDSEPAADVTAPTISTLSPADNAANVAVGSNLVVTFNENIQIGTGNITIKNLTDNTQSTIAITAGSPQITVSGPTLTINPGSDLLASKNYAIQIAATAIDDLAGNSFAGILNDTTWNFATAAAASLTETNLLAYFRADSGVTNTGGNASAWNASLPTGTSVSASQSTSGSRPAILSSSINNLPALDFDGSADFMTLGSALTLSGDFHIYAVLAGETLGGVVLGSNPNRQALGINKRLATATASIDNGAIDAITVEDGGQYSSAPAVTITGDGTGATATAVLTNGVITAIDVNNGGADYTEATVVIADTNARRVAYAFDGTAAGVPSGTTSMSWQTPGLIELRRTGNTLEAFYNGTSIGTSTNMTGSLTISAIGALSNVAGTVIGGYFDGRIADLAIYSAAHSGATQTAQRAYFNARFAF